MKQVLSIGAASLVLSASVVTAQTSALPNIGSAKQESSPSAVFLGTGEANPFDAGKSSNNSSASVAESSQGNTVFYRAGKKAVQPEIASPTSPEEALSDQPDGFPIPTNDDSLMMNDPETNVYPDVMTENMAEEANSSLSSTASDASSDESVQAEEAATEETHAAAPSPFSMMGSMSTIAQYAAIAVACGGGAFLFFFHSSKKKSVAKVAAALAEQQGGPAAPVDSERVKKALAAFHENPPTPVKTEEPPLG